MKIRIPTNKEYSKLVSLTGGDNEKMHWKNIYSWVDDTENDYNLDPSLRAVRGYHSARSWFCDYATSRYATVGFRPACELDIDTLPSDIKEGDTVIIGTIYMDGQPAKVPQKPTRGGDIANYTPGANLEIRPALNDVAYQVIGIYIGNGVAVADRVLLKNISYEDIQANIGPKSKVKEHRIMDYATLKNKYFRLGDIVFSMALDILMEYGRNFLRQANNSVTISGNLISEEMKADVIAYAKDLANAEPAVIIALIQRDITPIDGDGVAIPKLNNGHEDGVCPFCGGEIEYNGDQDIIDDSDTAVTWKCPDCGASGTACYHGVFAGHEDLTEGSVPGKDAE